MRILNAKETAGYIGCSKNNTLTMLNTGMLPGIKSGGRWLVSQKALDEWIDNETRKQSRERRMKR